MARGAEYSINILFSMLRALNAFEQMDRNPNTYELAQFLNRDQSVVIRYRNILEKMGLIEVIPQEKGNIVRLTERGKCIAKCLSGWIRNEFNARPGASGVPCG